MINALSLAFGWVSSHLKIILITSAVIAGAWVVWNYTAKIEEASYLRSVVETQTQTIINKERIIKGMIEINNANNRAIDERDRENEQLKMELEGLLDNLGDDIDNEAPMSLQELLRRLDSKK